MFQFVNQILVKYTYGFTIKAKIFLVFEIFKKKFLLVNIHYYYLVFINYLLVIEIHYNVETIIHRLISFAEFQAFESLLSEPDALYKVAFHLFDINGNGVISYGSIVV